MIAIFPEIINTARQRDMELLAVQVRNYFAGDAAHQAKLNVGVVISAVGITVERLPIEEDAVLCVRDIAGSFDVIAVVNERIKHNDQMQFLLAHLLGHFLLHVQPYIADGSWKTSGLREVISPMHRYSRALTSAANDDRMEMIEREADLFAAALLLPIGMVKRAAAKLSDHSQIASFFGTNESVIRRRLDDIQGLSRQPTSFMDAEEKLKQEERAILKSSPTVDILHSEKHSLDLVQMPKSVAANSYKTMNLRTSGPVVTSEQGGSPPRRSDQLQRPLDVTEERREAKMRSKGMDRIRELAMKLDKSAQIDSK